MTFLPLAETQQHAEVHGGKVEPQKGEQSMHHGVKGLAAPQCGIVDELLAEQA